MSPQVVLCEVGSRGSSAGGLCRAELAWREVGWIMLRRARIAQAGSGTLQPELGPRRSVPAGSAWPIGVPVILAGPVAAPFVQICCKGPNRAGTREEDR